MDAGYFASAIRVRLGPCIARVLHSSSALAYLHFAQNNQIIWTACDRKTATASGEAAMETDSAAEPRMALEAEGREAELALGRDWPDHLPMRLLVKVFVPAPTL